MVLMCRTKYATWRVNDYFDDGQIATRRVNDYFDDDSGMKSVEFINCWIFVHNIGKMLNAL